MIATVPRACLLAPVWVGVMAVALTACGSTTPGQSAAQQACRAYAKTMRHQVATTVEGNDAIWAEARADARRAAAADPGWHALLRDIDEFHSRLTTLQQARTADELDAYFAADRRVQADCASAGEDIGPL